MAETKTAVEPEIGKIYDVDHCRKWKFTVRVMRVSDEWVAGEIIEGHTNTIMDYNKQARWEVVDMRRSFVKFYTSKIQEELDAVV